MVSNKQMSLAGMLAIFLAVSALAADKLPSVVVLATDIEI